MRNFLLVVFMISAGVLTGRAYAAEAPAIPVQPPPGTFKMRPELKGQHPRLFFTEDDIADIRRRGRGPARFFVEAAKRSFGQYVGKDVPAEMPGWKRYLYGFWALFTMDMLYIVEGEQRYADTAKNWALWLAADRWWVGDGLTQMDALSGLAITYDILYDQFTEPERRAIRSAILEGIDYISQRFFVESYWTRDYQNNHMHNRIHGLAHGSFAIYGDDPDIDVQKYADLAISQIHNVVKWLPEDGSQHEGPGYWSFGHHWVVRMVHLAEHVTGEEIASQNPHFANAHYFRIYMTAPGWQSTFNIGDGASGPVGSPTTLCRAVAETGDPHGTAVLHRWMELNAEAFYRYPAWGLLWYDDTIEPRPIEELPLWRFWPDLEMFSIRSSWKDDAVGFVFKCGPPGGHRMQMLRGENWANVAHDHPDQNHFLLFAYGKMMAEDDGYPDPKLTRSHNTIVIDGEGQPREGTAWQQPFPYEQTGYLRDVFLSHNTAYAAGDGSRLYEGAEKFVRHIAFVGGQYVIILDDLVGSNGQEHAFEWRLHKDGDWKEQGPGHFAVADGDVTLDIRFLTPVSDRLESRFLPAEETARPCVAVTQRADRTKYLAVLVPQQSGQPQISAERLEAADCVAVRASGPDYEDLFAVAEGRGAFRFAQVEAGGAAALVRMKGADVESALLTRGTRLAVGGKLILEASQPSNLSWHRRKGRLVVEAEAPYKTKGGQVAIKVGGLRAGQVSYVSVDGKPVGSLKADRDGVVQVQVDLRARRVVQIGAGASGDAG